MKPSVSSYSFQQLIKEGKITQLDTVSLAHELGFEGIEFTDLCPDNKNNATKEEQLSYARRIREEADRVGIPVVGYMVGADLYKGSEEENEKEICRVMDQLDIACAMGAPLLRHDVCYKETVNGRFVGFDRMLPTLAKNARRITEYAATLGIRTCTENHGKIAQDSDRVERLYYAVDHPNYGLLVDIGNFACADEDSACAVSRVAPCAIHVHAKDFIKFPFGTEIPEGISAVHTRGRNRLSGCALGDGTIPVAQCLDILRSVGYDGYVSIEFEGNKPCLDELRLGLSRLRQYL
jgi:sugar phosphate isomerase/epimerase